MLTRRFSGMSRLYGESAIPRLAQSDICVVGLGGVGSWVTEGLARSGIGKIRLVDFDHVAESNFNRQLQAIESNLGKSKVLAMSERIYEINPQCQVRQIDTFINEDNCKRIISGSNFVIDACDDWRAKIALILNCQQNNTPLIVCGAAGGKIRVDQIKLADLVNVSHDRLLAKIRYQLRKNHAFPKTGKTGVLALYSTEAMRGQAPSGGAALACAGYGSSVAVTASFAMQAVAHVLNEILV